MQQLAAVLQPGGGQLGDCYGGALVCERVLPAAVVHERPTV